MIRLIFLLTCIVNATISTGQNNWDKMSSFDGGERERAVAFAIGNRGYVSTGQDTANQVHKDLWEYDPATNSWTQKADLPGVARRDAIGFTVGNRGYVGTGQSHSSSSFGSKLKDLYEYNPVSNAWIQKANYPGNNNNGIYYATAFATSSRGYVCCGKKGSSSYSAELWEFNPVSNTWTQRSPFPGGVRYGAASFVVSDLGYVGLGTDENYYRNDFYQYNPATNTWIPKTDFAGSERFNSVGFSIGSRGYFALGSDGGYKKELWEYNPASDSWQQRADLPGAARRSAIAFTVGNYGYVGLGKGLNGIKRSLYRYTPLYLKEPSVDESISITVFPNPVHDHCTFSLETVNVIQQATLIIWDIRGNKVHTSSIMNGNYFLFQRGSLPSGIYFYEIEIKMDDHIVMHSNGKTILQ